MTITQVSPETTSSVMSQSDRVMGVVANHRELEELTWVLEPLGVSTIDVLEGNHGQKILDANKHTFAGFVNTVLGDLETEMRRCYSQEVEDGRIVFAVPITKGNADEIVKAAMSIGAEHIAHFGTLVNENFDLPIGPATPSRV